MAKPMVEASTSSGGSGFLSPQPSSGTRLLPSPIAPPTASSTGSLRPQSGLSSQSNQSAASHNGPRDDASEGGAAVRQSHSQSVSSNALTSGSSKDSVAAEKREKQRVVRTLPPWVQTADDDEHADATSLLLPRTPNSVRPPSRNFMPTPKSNVPGRRFDHAREQAPVTLTSHVSEHASKWQQFARSTTTHHDHEPPNRYLDRPVSSRGQVMSDEWIKENMPDLEEPWHPIDQEEEEIEKGFWLFNRRRRSRTFVKFHKTLMMHPMVPLAVRMIVLIFSTLALSLSASIFKHSNNVNCLNSPSTWMALLVDIVAIIYTVYITYDEYTSKPLGLRSHNAKMRLIFLDLGFIVFDSANLSLAFHALTDERWACTDPRGDWNDDGRICPYTRDICTRQKALTATLLIALVAWLGTFSISTLRLIERVAR